MPRALALAALVTLAACKPAQPSAAPPLAYQQSGRGDDPRIDRSASGFRIQASEGEVGRVTRRGKALVLEPSEGPALTLGTDPNTRVVAQNRPFSVRDLLPGDEVRASYYLDGRSRIATRIELLCPAPR